MPRQSGAAARLAVAALLPLEVLLLSLAFEPSRPRELPDWAAAALQNASVVPRLAIAFAATLLLVLSARLGRVSALFARDPRPHPFEWVVVNAVCFAALAATTATVFAHATPANAAAWAGLCVATAASWALALAPAATWRRFVATERVALWASLAAALATWTFGLWVQHAWRPLAQWTLFLAQGLVRAIYPGAVYDPERGTVGTNRLVVEIAPECSGYEGLALITIFVATYLWLFRGSLDVRRALWLFPLGWLAIWLANVARIAAIVVVGTALSPAVAVQGFHSQAGWMTFAGVGLGLVWLSHRSGWFAREVGSPSAGASEAAALLVPFIAMLAAAMLAAALSLGFDALYPVVAIVAGAALWRYRDRYRNLGWELSPAALAIGSAVYAAWMFLTPERPSAIPEALAQVPASAAWAWIALRAVGSIVVVPMAEELAFRGYLLRKLVDREFERVPPGTFTAFSFAASSILFGLLHASWVAGTVAGAGFALALYRRGRLADAIVAHAVANGLIAATVLLGGKWYLW